MDELVSSAYRDAVFDGYRLGKGYEKLWLQTLGVDGLLFVGSLLGLRQCARLNRQISAASNLPTNNTPL